MKMDLIEKYHHEGKGYNPYLIRPNWQVAQLNHSMENKFFQIKRMDIHHKTDEVFILQKGIIILIAARIKGEDIQFETQLLNQRGIYNIPADCWHNLMMSEDAEVIIVENADAHLGDFEYYNLSAAQKEQLDRQVRRLLEEKNIRI